MYVAIHDGAFHADDVTAVAITRIIYPDLTFIRTRDPEIIAAADVAFDVGKKYDPETNRFDHHQKEGAGQRDTGVLYASAGLAWKHFGELAIRHLEPHLTDAQVHEVKRLADESFFANVDALDCGQDIPGEIRFSYAGLIDSFNPGWRQDQSAQGVADGFIHALNVSEQLVRNLIREIADGVIAADLVHEAYRKAPGKEKSVLLIEQAIPYETVVVQELKDVLYVVYPDKTGGWRVKVVRKDLSSYAARRDLPAAWGGLEREKLDAVTGILGGIFCHRGLFVAGHQTIDGALAMANAAVALTA